MATNETLIPPQPGRLKILAITAQDNIYEDEARVYTCDNEPGLVVSKEFIPIPKRGIFKSDHGFIVFITKYLARQKDRAQWELLGFEAEWNLDNHDKYIVYLREIPKDQREAQDIEPVSKIPEAKTPAIENTELGKPDARNPETKIAEAKNVGVPVEASFKAPVDIIDVDEPSFMASAPVSGSSGRPVKREITEDSLFVSNDSSNENPPALESTPRKRQKMLFLRKDNLPAA